MKSGSLALLVRSSCLASALLLGGCDSSTEVDDDAQPRGKEWVESSHGKVDPDTAKAFPAAGRTLVLAVPETTWTAMVTALTEACGGPTGCTGSTLDLAPKVSAWRKADLLADGQKWASVGFKLPSNGDLADAWKAGKSRFPVRITMDKWEKEVPTIDNQRFYGFQKLSLNNLESDSTGLRHQVAGALFRAQGVPAYRSGLVTFKIAHGKDTLDLGLYSLREMLDGPMLKRWFAGSDGNLYEPASTLAAFLPAEFVEGENDGEFSDVKQFVKTLNSTVRTTDRESWRNALSSTFDVDGFLSWLAISTALGDKGSYGNESTNYALYQDKNKLHWMALDLDETFPAGKSLSRGVWHEDAAGTWPLIANLLSDSVLCESYRAKVRALVVPTGPLAPATLTATVEAISGTGLAGHADAALRTAKLLAFAGQRATVIDTSLSNHTCANGN